MTTILLTCNPVKYAWAHRDEVVHGTSGGGTYPDRWSVGGRTGGVGSGDRAYLLRQGREPRGIVASGIVMSAPYKERHWNGTPGRLANYVDVHWDRAVDDDEVLPTALLLQEVPETHLEHSVRRHFDRSSR